jgi:hypothetical protein
MAQTASLNAENKKNFEGRGVGYPESNVANNEASWWGNLTSAQAMFWCMVQVPSDLLRPLTLTLNGTLAKSVLVWNRFSKKEEKEEEEEEEEEEGRGCTNRRTKILSWWEQLSNYKVNKKTGLMCQEQ